MRLDAISIGYDPPEDVNVVVEVPIGGEPIKYEMDKAAGTLVVDRFLHTPMRYPGNYGRYAHVTNYTDLPEITLQQIVHFFAYYKDLEPGKWATVLGWGDAGEARRLISEAIERRRPIRKGEKLIRKAK
jgi:inorganic pyrophosphatase